MIEIAVDYMQFNTESIPFLTNGNEQSSYMKNYELMTTSDDGIEAHYGNKKTKKYHIVAKGVPCARLFRDVSPCDYFDMMLENGARFTRLDIAVTEFLGSEQPYTADDIRIAYNENMIASTHANYDCKVIADSSLSPETLVMGRWSERGKHGIFRAYDKSLEMDIGKYLINRLEVEDKRDKAHVSARRIGSGQSLQSVFKSRFDIPNDEKFQAMMSNAVASVTRPKTYEDEVSKTYEDESLKAWGWIIHTVAPAIGKRIAKDHANGLDNTERQREFYDAIENAYREHMNTGNKPIN